MTDWRRKGESGARDNPGQFAPRQQPRPNLFLPREPRTPAEHSRRALITVVGNVLADHWDAITLVGAHAVMLRTERLELSQGTTGDGDLGITPALASDEPSRVDARCRFRAARPFPPGTVG